MRTDETAKEGAHKGHPYRPSRVRGREGLVWNDSGRTGPGARGANS